MAAPARTHRIEQPAPLLAWLFAINPGAKRKQVRDLLRFGAIAVNGRAVTQFDHPLRPGDVVTILPRGQAAPQTALEHGLIVRHEDDAILVVEKPAGLLSIAADGGSARTAYAALVTHVRRGNEQSRARVWIVHRLDRETSGLMIFAKTEAAKQILQEQWPATLKHYIAAVEGAPPHASGRLESYLEEANPARVKVAPPGPSARRAVTHYEVLQPGVAATLLQLRLETGRRHQIRVQLAQLGCPIVGDTKYGAKTDPLRRICLHAAELRLIHPTTTAPLHFTAPHPREWRRLLLPPRPAATRPTPPVHPNRPVPPTSPRATGAPAHKQTRAPRPPPDR